jgi:anaerobic ribonucleoside-triphosphate reductase
MIGRSRVKIRILFFSYMFASQELNTEKRRVSGKLAKRIANTVVIKLSSLFVNRIIENGISSIEGKKIIKYITVAVTNVGFARNFIR